MKKQVALSVAGIDTGNGAGVETDIKVFEILGVHGILAVSAITVQNTLGIKEIFPISSELLDSQISWLLSDFKVDSVKLGMLYNSAQFKVINDKLRQYKIVTDPVIYAKDGTQLINDIEDYKKYIIKNTTVLTPNAVEASILSGVKIESKNDQEIAAKKIYEIYGVPYVIIKGGHIKGDYSFDVLYDGKDFYEIGYRRISEKNTHGTGSVFASAIAAEIAKGNNIVDAIRIARDLLQGSIAYGLEIGKGIGPVDPFFLLKEIMKYEVLEDMVKFGDFIVNTQNFWKLIPEVQSNFAHSIDSNYVNSIDDIATFRGRIVKTWNNNVKVGFPAVFGNPTHTARLLFSIISKGYNANSLINIKYDEKIISLFKEIGYEVIEINRDLEPAHGENKTMQWIIEYIAANYGNIPKVIFDKGTKGKEAMIRFWTNSLEEMENSLGYICKSL
ncbi:bifunctional hydroxymethylpyrimidine kinase/phosphomethylpyrimidine kinase [Acidianus brierleyi]|uniref:Bifunctional hydroxymethylpyrimidine kinase/phosphomethylpyrimidine kinase n=1 Tax=Acidianus brierleyi TaxID=41673 RepID=A0A2U9IBE2_9CREN|nr:bifunctional hydroxymethylpyrimidine kinase/phosphomethylpyrimidine kinase [Acidianus brierleyi]AWR93337.1 bifunctional hydroxymethylpyrimidine kinase/phosphomethylpyrimidine kinase [Acidianus brierleyi]